MTRSLVALLLAVVACSSTTSNTGECDPIADDGCESGEGCYVVDDKTACTSSIGAAPLNAPCGEPGSCSAGLICATTTGAIGGCAQLCRLGESCSGGLECQPLPLPSGDESSAYGACLNCDAIDLAGGGCAAGSTCIPWNPANDPAGTLCVQTNGAPAGSSCSVSYDCAAGHVCIASPGQPGTCLRICRVGEACAGGLTCHPMNAAYGYCQ